MKLDLKHKAKAKSATPHHDKKVGHGKNKEAHSVKVKTKTAGKKATDKMDMVKKSGKSPLGKGSYKKLSRADKGQMVWKPFGR